LIAALVEVLTQGVPLFACTDLRKRETLSNSQRCRLVSQDEVTFSC